MISSAPGKNIKTISLLSDPNLKSYGFQESVVTVKTWFFEREKYSYKISDILIKGYLMLKDALENLPPIYSVRNMQQEVKIYGNIIHDVFSRSKAHGSDGRKPIATDKEYAIVAQPCQNWSGIQVVQEFFHGVTNCYLTLCRDWGWKNNPTVASACH